jgi:dTDP-4-amino-4,6-dideoxygalactose transaminase
MLVNRDTVEEFWSESDLAAAYRRADEKSLERFSRSFSGFLGVAESTIHFTSSGKSALKGLLKSRRDKRSVVMVPALNCARVKEAIEAANCEVETYDFQAQPGRFDWDIVLDAITPQVSVLIVTHLYGVPVDLRRVREFCSGRGIMLIEDCAQTLGGYVAGRQVGTWGDAAIFSFSYDKPISLGWGGMAVVNSPDLFVSEESMFGSPLLVAPSREIDLLSKFVKSMKVRRSGIRADQKGILSTFRRVYSKWNKAASLGQGKTIGVVQAELGVDCLERFSEVRSIRNTNASLFSSLCSLPTWPVMSGDIEPAWIKQKVFVSSPSQLDSISRDLRRKGIRAGNFNWPKLIEGERSQASPIAKQVATCWMDVPIHQRMKIDEIEDMVSVIRKHS